MAQKPGTALGVARARFVDGLPRKAQELKGAIALLVATPSAPRPREELRRRLHALYASAQVFRLESLASALKEAIQRLDAARDGAELAQEDLDELANLTATLPALGNVGDAERASIAPSGSPSAASQAPVASSVSNAPSAIPSSTFEVPKAPPPARSSVAARPPSVSSAKREPSPGTPGAIAASSSGVGRLPARPEAPLDTVVSVLVIDGVETQAAVREALSTERYELFGATDPEAGIRLARSIAPDVVLVDARTLANDPELIVRLHADSATELVPVGVLHDDSSNLDEERLRALGVDALLHKPATASALRRLVDRLVTRERSGPSVDALGDATVEEVADRLAREIRRGLVEATATGREERIELGDGSELLAAAWATIARVRTELADRSHGKVRFRDGAKRGGPAFMALAADDEDDHVGDVDDVSLEGRRVIVADDDPAVVWFFSGLLREAGAHAVECEDGREALEEARRRRPDVIVSDILMPGLDGLALCRELKRDPGLADVPVILLSWKEDFIQRMRELQSGASGYLRKEAGSGQILAKVREVLRPRARLEARLRAGGEVRGRIESVGVRSLLRATADVRQNARVTLRDAWSLFEVDVRDGQLVDVTRTATDGSFSRGERALPSLLGVSTGRFTVDDAEGTLRPTLHGDSEAVLLAAAERLGAHVDAVSGANLSRVALVRFDELLLQAFLRTSLGETRQLVERVAAGESPRSLLVEGRVSPVVLETALVDLARRGAVSVVRDDDGEDLVAAALEARRVHAAKPSVPAPPRPREEPREDVASIAAPIEHAAGERVAKERADADVASDEAPSEASSTDVTSSDASELLHAPTNPPPAPPGATRASLPPEAAAEPAPAAPKSPARATPEPTPAPASTPAEEPGGLGMAGWVVLVLLCGAAGYFGWRALRQTPEPASPVTRSETTAGLAADPATDARDESGTDSDGTEIDSDETEPATVTQPSDDTSRSELSFGETLPSIVDPRVPVAEGQGLLVVEASESTVRVALRRRGEERARELGEAPAQVALDEGQYELVFRSEAGESVRFLFVRAGQTRVVRPER